LNIEGKHRKVIVGSLHRAMTCRSCERGEGRGYAPDASGCDVLGSRGVERLRDAAANVTAVGGVAAATAAVH